MTRRLCTSIVRDAHAYTRSRLPWRLDTCEEEKNEKIVGRKFGRKLFHYISGGGMKSFGRTIQQEEADVRRTRFLIASAIIGAIWFWFLVA